MRLLSVRQLHFLLRCIMGWDWCFHSFFLTQGHTPGNWLPAPPCPLFPCALNLSPLQASPEGRLYHTGEGQDHMRDIYRPSTSGRLPLSLQARHTDLPVSPHDLWCTVLPRGVGVFSLSTWKASQTEVEERGKEGDEGANFLLML